MITLSRTEILILSKSPEALKVLSNHYNELWCEASSIGIDLATKAIEERLDELDSEIELLTPVEDIHNLSRL